MKLHRLVIAFILASSAAVLVAGLWFKPPAFPTAAAKVAAKVAPAPAAPATRLTVTAEPTADNRLATLTARQR